MARRAQGVVVDLRDPREAMQNANWDGPNPDRTKRTRPDPVVGRVRKLPITSFSKAHKESCPECGAKVGKTFHGKSYPVFAKHGDCAGAGQPWPEEHGPYTAKEKRLLTRANADTRKAATLERAAKRLRAKRKKP